MQETHTNDLDILLNRLEENKVQVEKELSLVDIKTVEYRGNPELPVKRLVCIEKLDGHSVTMVIDYLNKIAEIEGIKLDQIKVMSPDHGFVSAQGWNKAKDSPLYFMYDIAKD